MYMVLFFFFKQKTAYGLRISDWSSDVCSSDLGDRAGDAPAATDRAPAGADDGDAVYGADRAWHLAQRGGDVRGDRGPRRRQLFRRLHRDPCRIAAGPGVGRGE